jgi:hypothetical protein
LATSGDFLLATSGDFLMAMDTALTMGDLDVFGQMRDRCPAEQSRSTSDGRDMPNAGSCSWPGIQPCGGDWLVAHLTDPVTALL